MIKISKMFMVAVIATFSMLLATTTMAMSMNKAQFTTSVVDREPIDDLERLSNNFKSVFYFTDLRDCIGCKIEHQWWHKGKKVSSVKGKAKYARYRWWSKKTLTDDMYGDWTVKVYVNGKLVKTDTVNYYEASTHQRQQAPLSQRLKIEQLSECEVQLRYFSEKVEESPDDPYFNFMLKKWGSRCLPE